LVSRSLAQTLLDKRREIMITSYAYELIKQEGLEEGLEQGLKQGLEQGLERGRQEGLAEGLRIGLLQAIGLVLDMRFGAAGARLLPEIAAITDVGLLQKVLEQLRVVASPEELRGVYRNR
jgi:predicted transposase YdaD